MTEIHLKRIYDDPDDADGHRILADRLWPRGLRKADAAIDQWAKEATPSSELRSDFHHEKVDAKTFAQRYQAELDASGAAQELAADLPRVLTLLTAAKDPEHGHLPVLREALQQALVDRDGAQTG